MNRLIKFLQNLSFYTDNLNKDDIYIQYKFTIFDKKFKLLLLWQNKKLNFYQLKEFFTDKEINNFTIIEEFENSYYIIYINYLISLINEDLLLNDFINTNYFTFPAFKTRTELAEYYAAITNQNKKEIYKRLKEKFNY